MRRIIPFYSWVRHVVPNTISGITESPYLYSILPKAEGAIRDRTRRREARSRNGCATWA